MQAVQAVSTHSRLTESMHAHVGVLCTHAAAESHALTLECNQAWLC